MLLNYHDVNVATYHGLTDAVAARGYRIDCEVVAIDWKTRRIVSRWVVKGGDPAFRTKFGKDQWGRPPSERKIRKAIPLPEPPGDGKNNAPAPLAKNLLNLLFYCTVASVLQFLARRRGLAHTWLAWVPVLMLILVIQLLRSAGKAKSGSSRRGPDPRSPIG